jgi:hypothetical protein
MKFDATAFLESLFGEAQPPAPDPGPGFGPDDLPGDWRVEWEERAAVLEYDGGQPRERAEALALREIVAKMRRSGA